MKLDGNKATNKEVSPVYGDYIVDLSNMVATFENMQWLIEYTQIFTTKYIYSKV